MSEICVCGHRKDQHDWRREADYQCGVCDGCRGFEIASEAIRMSSDADRVGSREGALESRVAEVEMKLRDQERRSRPVTVGEFEDAFETLVKNLNKTLKRAFEKERRH